MAKIEFAFPVDKIHGKVGKSHKIGFADRTASKLNYSVEYGKRSTKPSDTELAHRDKFAVVASATRSRMKDPSKINADQLAYQEVKTQYPSLYAYVFNQEWAAYEG